MRSRSPCWMARTVAAHSTQIVARGGEQAALGNGAAPVAGAAHALQRDRNRARRIDLADQVDVADIDAELQRSGRHQQANLAVLQLALGVQAQLARQAAVMRGHQLFADALAQMQRHALRQPPRVDEHQRRAMLQRQLRDAVVDLAPHLVAGDGAKLGRRDLHRQVELAAMANVDDGRSRTSRAGQEMRDLLNRLLRRREPDARWPVRQQVKPLQRERQVRAALVVGDGVDFVHDYGLDIAQDGAAAVGGEQNVERLRRGDQDVRRPLQHLAPLFHQRVAGADGGANLGHQQAALGGQRQNLAQRPVEVLLNVVAQRLERRDVQNFGAVAQVAVQRLAHQAIDADEKCGQRLARTGGSGDQRGAAGKDLRPALLLRLGGRTEAPEEPLRNQRMRPGQRDRNFPHRHPAILAEFRQLFAGARKSRSSSTVPRLVHQRHRDTEKNRNSKSREGRKKKSKNNERQDSV